MLSCWGEMRTLRAGLRTGMHTKDTPPEGDSRVKMESLCLCLCLLCV